MGSALSLQETRSILCSFHSLALTAALLFNLQFSDGLLEEGGRGLPAMKQRAELLGGNLTVWSKADSGTDTELIIPATA